VDFTDPPRNAVRRSPRRFSVFLDDEWVLTDTLSLSLGGRIEHNNYSGIELQPEVRLAWEPKRGHTLWVRPGAWRPPADPLWRPTPAANFASLFRPARRPVKLYLADNTRNQIRSRPGIETGYRGDLSAKLSWTWRRIQFLHRLRSVKLAGFSPGAPTSVVCEVRRSGQWTRRGSGKPTSNGGPGTT
jgi:hypothetical protein